MRTTIPQVFDEVEKAATTESKVRVLRAYDHPVIRHILRMNFDPAIKVYLPEGEPPFKKDTSVPMGYSETNLFAEFRRFYIWLDPKINLTRTRKEQLFVQMLEGIHWTEAELVCLAKDKELTKKYKSLKENVVREAFPDLLPPPVKVPTKVKEPKKKASLDAS